MFLTIGNIEKFGIYKTKERTKLYYSMYNNNNNNNSKFNNQLCNLVLNLIFKFHFKSMWCDFGQFSTEWACSPTKQINLVLKQTKQLKKKLGGSKTAEPRTQKANPLSSNYQQTHRLSGLFK